MTESPLPDVVRDPQTHAIIGAAMRVHTQLGFGFHEPVYREALAIELVGAGVPFQQEPHVAVWYGGRRLATSFRPDYICFDQIIVELKAISLLGTADYRQVIGYLKATRLERGLLLNFGRERLEFRRFVLSG